MEFIIGIAVIAVLYIVYKFIFKDNTTPEIPNAYKFPEDPLVEKDPNQGPDSI